MIRFSVIVPNYNHGKFLKQRIDSILQQTYDDFELIILDDCSTDESIQVIESYRGHKKISEVITNKQNSGSPFCQWKNGINSAAGEWIWIAESDDYADPSFLEKAATSISRFPLAGIFYSDSYLVDEIEHNPIQSFSQRKNQLFNSKKWSSSYIRKGKDEINEYLKLDCTINNVSAVIFRKSVIKPFLNELKTFRYYGDWFVILKVCFVSDVCYLDQPLNYYRKHGGSLLHSKTSLLISKTEYFRILKLLYDHPQVTDKKQLLNFFTYNYLAFGILEDGFKPSIRILVAYLKISSKLAFKVIQRLGVIKIFRKKWPLQEAGKH